MQAVILAAGKSTRTYPLTLTKPKPLLQIAGTTILEHNLRQLEGVVDEVILVVGYRQEMIRTRIGDRFAGLKISYVVQEKQDGNGSALIKAKPLLQDRFIAMVGDDLYARQDIKSCVKHRYCVLAKDVTDLSRFGEVLVDNDQVRGIREKPGKKPGLANTGLLVLDTTVFEHQLKKSKRGEYEITDYISFLAEKGQNIHYHTLEEYWIPLTYAWNLLEANAILMRDLEGNKLGTIEKGATIKGPVHIGKGTIIKAGAYIEGPVIIGENCTIGPNCFIRASSFIGQGSKIGNAVEIKNSIVGPHTSIGHLSYVGDSVIGDKVNFGAGTITANLRHDNADIRTPVKGEMVDTDKRKLGAIIGDGVHTGINTSIYPGRKLWPNTQTLPGEIVKKDKE